jgi:hypothetical protein
VRASGVQSDRAHVCLTRLTAFTHSVRHVSLPVLLNLYYNLEFTILVDYHLLLFHLRA